MTGPARPRPGAQASPAGSAAPPRWRRSAAVAFEYTRRLWDKAAADDIFFLAAAIAFNVLVAFVPLVLAVLGMAGFLLRQQQTDPTGTLLRFVLRGLPPLNPAQEQYLENLLRGMLEKSISFLSVGTIILVWFATRIIGTLRSALKSVFDLPQDRGVIVGKIFDAFMVFAAGALFTLNVGLTFALDVLGSLGLNVLGLRLTNPTSFHRIYVEAAAFVSLWTMFLLIYHFLPARRTSWAVSTVAASFASVLFEVLKQAFSYYILHLADYTSTYNNLATLVVVGLWIYYSAVVFILGGELAQLWGMRRIRQRQKERLE